MFTISMVISVFMNIVDHALKYVFFNLLQKIFIQRFVWYGTSRQ